jgi:hypothetical protein
LLRTDIGSACSKNHHQMEGYFLVSFLFVVTYYAIILMNKYVCICIIIYILFKMIVLEYILHGTLRTTSPFSALPSASSTDTLLMVKREKVFCFFSALLLLLLLLLLRCC